MNKPFYFSTIRNLTAAFGSLFNDIYIRRFNTDGAMEACIKVPLAYSPADKTIVMLQQRNPFITQNKIDIKVSLPRMGFELTGMSYDNTRKLPTLNKNLLNPLSPISFSGASGVNTTTNIITSTSHGLENGRTIIYDANGQTVVGGLTDGQTYYGVKVDNNNFKLSSTSDFICGASGPSIVDLTSVGTGTQYFKYAYGKQYAPVPYNFEFKLYIFVKYIDDGLQIVEQIVPYFAPFYTVTMNDIKPYEFTRDVPISLVGITSSDTYQGDVAEDRIINWELTFSAKGWVYPPIKDAAGVIKIAHTNFFELGADQKLETVTVEVDPFTANRDDDYVINTTITSY